MKKLLFALIFAAPLFGQGGLPFKTPRVTFTDPNGVPLANGCVYSYAGGTSTPQATYTDYTDGTPNTNPVILDSTGSAVIWLGANTYKFVGWSEGGTNCATGVQQWSVDQVPGNSFMNGTISGATITNSTITDSTIDSSVIGGTVPAAVNATYLNGPIGTGGGTPAAGAFTSISQGVDALAFSSTPVFPAATYASFTMTLTGNVVSSTITGSTTGQVIHFNLCQDGTGGRTFVWPSGFVSAPTMPATASACMTPMFLYDGANWQFLNNLGLTSGAAYDAVPFSSTPVFPVNPATIFAFTLTGNVASSTITGSEAGQVIAFNLCQNSTGGYTFAWPASFLNPPPLPQAASVCITPTFFNDGTNWNQLSLLNPSSAQVVTFSGTPAFDATAYNQFSMTLTGNVTSSSLTGGVFGEHVDLDICQNGTGGYTFIWPTNVINPPTISATASACTNALVVYDGSQWDTVSVPAPLPHQMVGFWSGTSCTMADDGGEGAGCAATQSWGSTLPATYYWWCTAGPFSSGTLSETGRFTVNQGNSANTTTTFTYVLDNMQSGPRGSTIPMTCWATN